MVDPPIRERMTPKLGTLTAITTAKTTAADRDKHLFHVKSKRKEENFAQDFFMFIGIRTQCIPNSSNELCKDAVKLRTTGLTDVFLLSYLHSVLTSHHLIFKDTKLPKREKLVLLIPNF